MNEMNEIKGGKGEREKGRNEIIEKELERIRKKEGKRKKIKKKRAKGKK